jgi:hypothetical protein
MAMDAHDLFFDFAFQYYVARRTAFFLGVDTVTGNLLHHAIEMSLKGSLDSVKKPDARAQGSQQHGNLARDLDRISCCASTSVDGGNIHFLRNGTAMVFWIMDAWGQEHFVVMHFFVGDDAQEMMHAV